MDYKVLESVNALAQVSLEKATAPVESKAQALFIAEATPSPMPYFDEALSSDRLGSEEDN